MRRPLSSPRLLLLAPVLLLLACAEPAPDGLRTEVIEVVVDPTTGTPVVLLRELAAGKRVLPIWIGPGEAQSIASHLSGAEPPRPNSHDLTKRLVDGLEGQVVDVTVTDLRSGVYYARIRLAIGQRHFDVDARPSDAIAIALRYDAPIFVSESLFEKASQPHADRQEDTLRL